MNFFNKSALTNVNVPATLDGNSVFEATSVNSIDADLHIEGSAEVLAGAAFSGSGALVINTGSTLYLRDGATLEVELENDGTAIPGSSPGVVTVGSFTQHSGGSIDYEIEETAQGIFDFDRLIVTDEANLSGSLDLATSFIDPIAAAPDYFDTIQIMTFAARVGRFEKVTGAAVNDAMTLAAVCSETDLSLIAALPGDTNLDGSRWQWL